MNPFLKSDYLFLLLAEQGCNLPLYNRANYKSEYGISAEDFVYQHNYLAMEDVKECWDGMTIEEKDGILSLALRRINEERNYLKFLEKGVKELEIEIKTKKGECA